MMADQFKKSLIGNAVAIALLGVPVFFGASQARATILTMTDLNSAVNIDTGSQAGMNDWLVDGVDQIFQQWFWYRVGATGPEHSIDTLTQTSAAVAGRNAAVSYAGTGFSVDVNYLLTGGTAGSRTSDIGESIRIINTSGAPLDFHFIQYSDFDLNGVIGGQTVTFPNANAVRQVGGGAVMSESVVTPPASHHEASTFSLTRDSLNDALTTTLNDSNSATGDATWAFQWDVTIVDGGSFLISKDKRLEPLPEPGSGLLLGLGLGLIGIATRTWRRRRSV